MGNKMTGIGALLSATGFGLPIGLPLLAMGIADGGLQPHVPDIKPPDEKKIDEAAAAAREKERRRVVGGSTTFSGRKVDALSASIGKRMLGGSR